MSGVELLFDDDDVHEHTLDAPLIEQAHDAPMPSPNAHHSVPPRAAMPMGPMHEQMHRIARDLLAEAGYRVLAPFVGGARQYNDGAERAIDECTWRTGLLIDVESTGADARTDEIIQLAVLPFSYCERRRVIFAVDEPCVSLTEARNGVKISPEAYAVHGIDDAMTHGHHVDVDALRDWFQNANLLVAHNAAFDAPMFVRTFPDLAGLIPWACSLVDIPWKQRGYESARLGALLQDHTQHHFSGHDAGRDVLATAHVLATPFADGTTPFGDMLENALTPRVRIIADDAPFKAKDLLKGRGYRWNDYTKPGARLNGVKAWFTEIPQSDEPAEREWLASIVYGSLMPDHRSIRVFPLHPATRFYQ